MTVVCKYNAGRKMGGIMRILLCRRARFFKNMLIGGPARVLTLEGDVNLRLLPQIAASFERTITQKPARLVIDFCKVRYIDCSIIALLVTGMQNATTYGGRLMLAGVPKNVRRMFQRVRLGQCFLIYPTVDAALDAP
jgi:anti-sigma B factor antagonist